ncbi:MAG TPA: sulfatase-like hydrolase/transferase [Candidatus Polarisedimenticolaceae bacterium]|nr:sulfatase-like hydrolase/transferase [Candidatus Polarisedimenticolaceae bacterium]
MTKKGTQPFVPLVLCCVALLAAGCGPGGPPPDILLVTLDATRADRLGCYGHAPAATPAIDALAGAGVRFDRAYAQAPLTLPSHVSLLTGTYPAVHGVRVDAQGRVPEGVETLAERLAEAGWETAAFVSSFDLGAAFGLDRGFDLFDSISGDGSQPTRIAADRPADATTDAALAWLEARGDRPFFAWLHYNDAHWPYNPPAELTADGADPYDGEIAFVDRQLARVVAWLESTGRLERTLIVVAADHGESLDDHGEPRHGLFVYDATVRVPLIVRWPARLPAGLVVDEPVALIDVLPTILDLTGLGIGEQVDGRSLRPAFDGKLEAADVVGESHLAEIGYGWAPLAFLVRGGKKFIDAPVPELYDLEDDPGELRNLAPALPGETVAMREALFRIESRMTPLAPHAAAADPETRARLESLGYLGGTSPDAPAGDAPDPKTMIALLRGHFYGLGLNRAGRYQESVAVLEQLVAESPRSCDPYADLGWSYLATGRSRSAEGAYRESLRALPQHGERLWGLAEALRRQGRYEDAIEAYRASLVQRPEMFESHLGLALSYGSLQRFDEAFEHTRRQVEINPSSTIALTNLTSLGVQVGEFEAAISASERLVELDPTSLELHFARWNAMTRSGKPEREIAALRDSHRRFPDQWMFIWALAWRLAVTRDTAEDDLREAVRLGEQAVELNPNHARSWDAFAAAQAAVGDYEQAVAAARQAHALAAASPDTSLAGQIAARLESYETGRPYYE